eukprot:scaffold2991_cov250-Pinguiococcus_pyrenoidosus.AAC.3
MTEAFCHVDCEVAGPSRLSQRRFPPKLAASLGGGRRPDGRTWHASRWRARVAFSPRRHGARWLPSRRHSGAPAR